MTKTHICIRGGRNGFSYLLSLLVFFPWILHVDAAQSTPRCLYISSYHTGYAWSDGVAEGVSSVLAGKCELRQFDMDTKRKRSPEEIKKAVATSIDLIKSWKPDIVITSDDNAAKHLIVPHYMNSELPFVFSGINWTVEEYGFPVRNVTGIVEVAPIEPMLKEAMKISGGSRGVYIGANTLTESKNFSRIEQGAKRMGMQLEKRLVSDAASWIREFDRANNTADYIVMGSNSGIKDWDSVKIEQHVHDNASAISVTNHRWMMPVTALGYTKIPQEHGEWAAKAALEILGGVAAQDIPIVTNRRWDIWINQAVLNSVGGDLSSRFLRKAKKYSSIAE